MCLFENLKARILKGIITRSEMGNKPPKLKRSIVILTLR